MKQTQLPERFVKALDAAFRDPVVLQEAIRYLTEQQALLTEKRNQAATAALYNDAAKAQALVIEGSLKTVTMQLELVTRWTL